MSIELEELKSKICSIEDDLIDLSESIDINKLRSEIEELEFEVQKPGFYDDTEKMQKTLQKIKQDKDKLESYEKLNKRWEDLKVLVSLAIDEGDDSLIDEIKSEYEDIVKELEEQRLSTLLNGEYDSANAILTFHAGAGGTEAQDWVSMLYRMYSRWCEKKGYRIKVLDYLEGDEAGIKSVSIMVEGYNAYGYLKGEMGVHRLVRISPFDASGRRHTSFASLEVMPEIDDKIDIEAAVREASMLIKPNRP